MLNVGDVVWTIRTAEGRGTELVEAVAVASADFWPAPEYDELLRRKIPIHFFTADARGLWWCLASDEEEVAAFKVAHALR